jgi:FAD binding domain
MSARSTGLVAGVEVLAGRVRGRVLRPGDDGWDQERAGFQRALQHRPAAIVGAAGPEDLRLAVEFAAAHGLPVAVQATGHGLAHACAGGVLITTGRMAAVRVDARAHTAWVEAGATSEQVVQAAAPNGLAPLSGSAPHVGAVSYTLGGGLGLLARRYGYASDHVRAVDVVTAEAKLRRVTASSDPDLFWALRGGRDNFGVATGMEIDLLPVARLYGGGLYFAAEHAASALETWRRWTATVPEELTSSVALIPYPDVPGLPEPLRGRWVAHVRVVYLGDPADGERLVAPLRAAGPRLIDRLGEMPYTESGSIHNDPTFPDSYVGSNVLLDGLDASLPRTVVDLVGADAPVPCVVELPPRRCALPAARRAQRRRAPAGAGHGAGAHPAGWRRSGDRPARARPLLRGAAALDRRALPQLHLRPRRHRRPGPGGLRAGRLPAPPGAEGHLRPRQPVPLQPQHPAGYPLTVIDCAERKKFSGSYRRFTLRRRSTLVP